MKIKYVIEADEHGYQQEVYVDDVLEAVSHHATTDHGSKIVSDFGSIDEQLWEIEKMKDVSEEFITFLGFHMMMHCQKMTD